MKFKNFNLFYTRRGSKILLCGNSVIDDVTDKVVEKCFWFYESFLGKQVKASNSYALSYAESNLENLTLSQIYSEITPENLNLVE